MKASNINWTPALFLIIYQSLLIICLPIYLWYSTPSLAMVLIAVVLFFCTGISITGGYHRFYSHRSYRTNRFVESILLFFGSMAFQGSALRWSFDHRLHHAHVDTDEDPYSISKGFWYAHCLWLLKKPKPIEAKVVPDLLKNPLVMFQHNHDRFCMIASNVLSCLAIGWLLDDYLGALVIATFTRMFVLHHSTWFINSLAHTWGDKPFCQEQSAVNNYIISLMTFGEGYHNFHHTFANDYRNGIKWYHFDPTKWMIWTLHKLGLANGLKQVDALVIKKRLIVERKNWLFNQIPTSWGAKREEFKQRIQELSDRLVEKVSEVSKLSVKYEEMKKTVRDQRHIQQLREELERLNKSIREDWQHLKQMSKAVLQENPA